MPFKNAVQYNSPGIEQPSNDLLLSRLIDYYMAQTPNADHRKSIHPDNNDMQQLNLKQRLNLYHSTTEALQDYLDSHKLWTANFHVDERNPSRDDHNHSLKSYQLDNFVNYLHVPRVLGKEPPPGLVHHTSTGIGDEIYSFGGIINIFTTQASENIDVSRFHIKCDAKFPFPLDDAILHNPTMVPNNDLYVLSSETNHLIKPEINGEVPPPLICMSSSPITERHIFYYGGFQFHDTVEFRNEEFFIEREVELNNHGYILDIVTFKFRKFELVASPTVATKYPVTVPRFGHTSSSINVFKRLDHQLRGMTLPATVFIMGGFETDGNNKNRFKPIGDLWKVEFSIRYNGKHNYLVFNDTVLATPISNVLQAPNFPTPRGFHVAELVDSKLLKPNSTIVSNSREAPLELKVPIEINRERKVGLSRPESPVSSISQLSFDSERFNNKKLDLKLLIHGGSSKGDILGDTWYFDLDDEVWTQQITYFPKYDEKFNFYNEKFKCQTRSTSHHCAIIDKYLVLFNGCTPGGFKNLNSKTDSDSSIPDISHLAVQMTNNDGETYRRLFVLNLSNNTWVIPKVHHHIGSLQDNNPLSSMASLGSTVTYSGTRFISIGGVLRPNLKTNPDMEGVQLLSSAVAVYEFPLGSFTHKQSMTI